MHTSLRVPLGLALLALACSPSRAPEPAPSATPPPPAEAAATPEPAPPPAEEPPEQEEPPPPPPAPCPEGMVYVDVAFCDKVEDTCVKEGRHNREKFFPICGEYARERRCVGERWTVRVCVDRYEYPNIKGAHPPVVVDAWDASAMCREQGKRLCWENEWTAACEGRGQTPFPYGFARAPDSSVCRNDVPKLPSTRRMWSTQPKVQDKELRLHDASVRSGALPECKSDLGVHDLTGNFDEWTLMLHPLTEEHRLRLRRSKTSQESTWAVLKGGWWGRVRNACRPTLVGHREDFRYYEVSFRCCKTPDPAAFQAVRPEDAPPLWIPPPEPRISYEDNPWNDTDLSRGWTPDYPTFSVFDEAHRDRRARAMRAYHRSFIDPLGPQGGKELLEELRPTLPDDKPLQQPAPPPGLPDKPPALQPYRSPR